MDKKLNEAVAALRPQMVAALQRLVRRRSVEADPLPGKPFGEEVDACFAEALTLCHELGFETTDMDRYIGWCEIGTGDEMVAVLGHLDVVPEGEGWHHPPYAAEIEGGRLYGRGAIDDKGPVVASLFALKAIRDLGIPLNRRVRLLFGLNEETNDRDVLYYKAHGGEIPVLGFTPDGEYPLINGEKGILNESYAVQLHQTGAWQLSRVQGGVAGNVVPDYACAVLTAPAGASLPEAEHITVTAIPGGYQVEAVGVSAHGSHPEQGENAIGRLVCYLDRLPLEGDARQAVHFLAEKLGTDPYGERLLGHRLEDALSGPMSCNWGLIEGDAQHLWVTEVCRAGWRYAVEHRPRFAVEPVLQRLHPKDLRLLLQQLLRGYPQRQQRKKGQYQNDLSQFTLRSASAAAPAPLPPAAATHRRPETSRKAPLFLPVSFARRPDRRRRPPASEGQSRRS